MKKFGLIPVVGCAMVLLVISTMAVASENRANASSARVNNLVGTCPKVKPDKLPPAALAGATRDALVEAPELYNSLNTKGRFAETAYRGMKAPVHGFYRKACPHRLRYGKLLQKRSIQVDMIFPHYIESASLSQHWVFVARFDGEYWVWGVYR